MCECYALLNMVQYHPYIQHVVSYLDLQDEIQEEYIDIYVTNPTLIPSETETWLAYQYYYPKFTGTNYNSVIQMTSDNEEVAKVYNNYYVYLTGGQLCTKRI